MEDSGDSGRGTCDDPFTELASIAKSAPDEVFKTDCTKTPSSQSCDFSFNERRKSARSGRESRSSLSLSQIEARRMDSLSVELDEDRRKPWITGIGITKDGERIMTDHNNRKVKLFTANMDFKDSLRLSDNPYDVAVFDDGNQAAVTLKNKHLAMLDTSDGQLRIKSVTELSYDVRGIATNNDKLIVTCLLTEPPSVRLIDKDGTIYWSVALDEADQPLFRKPCYVISHSFKGIASAVITDRDSSKITVLNIETGEVIAYQELKGTGSRGITSDSKGNIYVCYQWTGLTSVLTGDLSEERILLFRRDKQGFEPLAIACDKTSNLLVISYYYSGTVGCFELS